MFAHRRGRPKKNDPNRKKITLDEAVELTKKFWEARGKTGYSKGHIYNLCSKGKIEHERTGKGSLVFEDEIKRKLCG